MDIWVDQQNIKQIQKTELKRFCLSIESEEIKV